MIAIITVTGLDHTGIVAAVSTRLAQLNVNILNISQTILGNYFTMILECEFDEQGNSMEDVQSGLLSAGEDQRVDIRIQSQSIFKAMHEL